MGCSAPRVHQICRYVSSWLSEQPAEPSIPAIRARHDLVFKWLLAESLTEWDRSKQPLKTTRAKIVRGRVNQAGAPLPDLVTSEQIEQERCGDPRYLQLADQLLKSQRAMWGADAPKRSELTGADGGPITIATILKCVAENPPPAPAQLESHPANVMNVDAVLAQLLGQAGETIDVECSPPDGVEK